MQFQISPGTAERFASATAAYIRSRADFVQELGETKAWNTLWLTFRDANNATLTVPDDCAQFMYRVWGNPHVWESEDQRQMVKDELRPQWQRQMRGH